MEYITLNNGIKIPQLGLGTYLLKPDDAQSSVTSALGMGYELIDTANAYVNERAVGRGVRESDSPRENVFLETKLWPYFYNSDTAVSETLERLNTPYIDLMILHQPAGDYLAGYEKLEIAHKEGKLRSIGISNFDENEIEKLLANCEIVPYLIQVECHPYFPQTELKKLLAQHDIALQAWYPLGGRGNSSIMNEPVVRDLAVKYGKTPAQIIMRWHIQEGNIVIPGSKNPTHIADNIDVFDFELTDSDMTAMATLDRGNPSMSARPRSLRNMPPGTPTLRTRNRSIMQYTTLGHSGIKVSKLCLGGMSFGEPSPDFHQWTIGPDDTRAVIKRALDTGINFIDTANCYSFGTSEEYIGAALRNLGIARESVVLASKVHFNEGGLSADAIKREIEGSLKRLGTDYLDLYIIHRFDYDVPMEETMGALNDLVREGKVRALGASAMYAYQLHNLQIVARDHGWTPFTSMQCHYNLLYREDEREMIPVCRQFDMALTPYSPMASGHLCRPTWESSSTRGTTDTTMANKYDHDRVIDMPVIERVAKIAADHDVPMSQIALAWHWARGVAAPIVGCSKPERVDDAVAALDITLSPAEIDFLEELYQPHALVGPKARPGEKPLAGTTKVKIAK